MMFVTSVAVSRAVPPGNATADGSSVMGYVSEMLAAAIGPKSATV
jgi:hypothetical protein